MKLWTIQPLSFYDKLIDENIINGNQAYIDDDFLNGYEWMIKKMENKIGKRPCNRCYPIWAWYQYNSINKPRPDLRNSAFLKKGTKGVRLEIEKNEEEVLLSDFNLWHFPLTYNNYIGDSEFDSLEFDNY